MDGYPDGSFRPEVPVSRSEFAAMLARALGWVPDSSASVQYTDVDPAAWDAGYIASMSERGLLSGYEDGTFKPQGLTNRAETVTLISKLLQLTGLAGS
ncbi:hypothetical protein J2T17_007410 [Paenibacillus mucilaginosus]